MCDPLPIKAEVTADLTYAADTLADMGHETHKGIGKIAYACYGPTVERRIGQAKIIAAQAERDSLDILAGKKRLDEVTGKVVTIANVSTLDALCNELVQSDSTCKAKRLLAVLLTASTEITQIPEEQISDTPINQTFFNRWRKEAELVDDEELRKWWAHLLVEETKKPNTISPRTLDVAKNLSREEALLFKQFIKGVIDDVIILGEHNTPLFGSYTDCLLLQEAGLIRPAISGRNQKFNITMPGQKKGVVFPFYNSGLAIVVEKEDVTFVCNTLSSAGKELYDIAGTTLTIDDIKVIANEISRQNHNASVEIISICKNPDSSPESWAISWTSLWSNSSNPMAAEKVQNDHR